jgi:hypothetical protein
MGILALMDVYTPETYNLVVLEAVGNKTLESHSSVLLEVITSLLSKLPDWKSHNVQPQLLVRGKIMVSDKWNGLGVFSILDRLPETKVSTSFEK